MSLIKEGISEEKPNILQALLLQREDLIDQFLDTEKKDYIVVLKSVDTIGRYEIKVI